MTVKENDSNSRHGLSISLSKSSLGLTQNLFLFIHDLFIETQTSCQIVGTKEGKENTKFIFENDCKQVDDYNHFNHTS